MPGLFALRCGVPGLGKTVAAGRVPVNYTLCHVQRMAINTIGHLAS